MNFKQAFSKLEKIADGKYVSAKYGLTKYESGRLEQSCWIYIDCYEWYTGDTWEDAFAILERDMYPKKIIVDDIEQIEQI